MILDFLGLPVLPSFSELIAPCPPDLLSDLRRLGRVGVFGGAVRDRVLGARPGDLDLLVMAQHASVEVVCLRHGLAPVYFTLGRGATPLPSDHAERARVPRELLFFSGGGVEVSSAPNIYGWRERPTAMDQADFSVNNIVVWDDGKVSEHPLARADLRDRVLRVVNHHNATDQRAERFLSRGFRWSDEVSQ